MINNRNSAASVQVRQISWNRRRRSPHLLDDHTVERIKQVSGVQRDDMWLWVETGERWQTQDLTAVEAAKVDQCVAAVEAFAASNAVILALADEPAAGTIEATLARSDLELGVESLGEAVSRSATARPRRSLCGRAWLHLTTGSGEPEREARGFILKCPWGATGCGQGKPRTHNRDLG
ncbi:MULTISPECIES: hypothetical protein [unclassified Nonomuraea]|uniref:hypothetical protein n=1 Tax=unclassified Nonomuraea TaxID=2593643 RepID=UPI0033E72639